MLIDGADSVDRSSKISLFISVIMPKFYFTVCNPQLLFLRISSSINNMTTSTSTCIVKLKKVEHLLFVFDKHNLMHDLTGII